MDNQEIHAASRQKKHVWLIPVVLLVLIAAGLLIWKLTAKDKPKPAEGAAVTTEKTTAETETPPERSDNWHTGEVDGTTYYVLDKLYSGDFHVQEVCFYEDEYESFFDASRSVGIRTTDWTSDHADFSLETVLSLEEYTAYCKKWGLTPAYTDPDSAYAILSGTSVYSSRVEVQLADVRTEGDTVTLYLRDRFGGGLPISWGFVLTVPVDPTVKELKLQPVCNAEEFENLVQYGVMYNPVETAAPEKPVIYLYPETETLVRVLLEYDGELTCTYPAYNNGWEVTASPDGTLTDAAGKTYSYLYWEGAGPAEYDFSKGFCVRGEDTAAFLEAALEKLGLNRREANEFIVYWLPRMEDNPWNLIAFQNEAYTDSARLEISPAPNSLIRVFMAWKPLTAPVDIEPQPLDAPARTGFTVVEWGGAELR